LFVEKTRDNCGYMEGHAYQSCERAGKELTAELDGDPIAAGYALTAQ
jgi:hypothetical protein